MAVKPWREREAAMNLNGALNAASFAVYLELVFGTALVPGEEALLD